MVVVTELPSYGRYGVARVGVDMSKIRIHVLTFPEVALSQPMSIEMSRVKTG